MKNNVKKCFTSLMAISILFNIFMGTYVSAKTIDAETTMASDFATIQNSEREQADIVVDLDRLDDSTYVAAVNSELAGYAHRVTGTGEGSFNVYVTGSACLSAGLTFRSDCDSNDAFTIVDLKRPNSGYILHNAGFYANDEQHYTFYLGTSGTYKVNYNTCAPTNSVHLQIWIYKNS